MLPDILEMLWTDPGGPGLVLEGPGTVLEVASVILVVLGQPSHFGMWSWGLLGDLGSPGVVLVQTSGSGRNRLKEMGGCCDVQCKITSSRYIA